MRLTKLIVLSVTIVAVSLFSMTAGAIYLEGQAPPDDTSPHILAASSGLADSGGTSQVVTEGSAGGLMSPMLPASFGYPTLSAAGMTDMRMPSAGFGTLWGCCTASETPAAAAAPWSKLSRPGFIAGMPSLKSMWPSGR
ncbi:hypothetical protein [Methanocella sp. MCL-LM]|uniref:hypothetical protein n=1 Tax=Methanocella sp. MCL-LM TaxID=3412035 RepID=UPI003C78D44B